MSAVVFMTISTGTSFYLLLSVVPLYADAKGAGGLGAGFTTGALMLSTVVAEVLTPALLSRFGYGPVLAAAFLLLGLPAFFLPASTSLAPILAICVLRGAGLAVAFVATGALVALLVPSERRGEGLAIMGVASLAPSVLALPLGVWLSRHVGYSSVFVIAGAAALLGLLAVTLLLDLSTRGEDVSKAGQVLRSYSVLRPSIIFFATAIAGGAIVTFVPLAVKPKAGDLVAVALLAQAFMTAIGRWWAGRYGDRHGHGRLLLPATVVVALGGSLLVMLTSPAALVLGMALFGGGFGVVQNSTYAIMFDQAPRSAYGAVSSLWSVAYDSGWGLGGAAFGFISVQAGYPIAFGVAAGIVFLTVPLAWPGGPARVRLQT
jgi:predicted MFS family arabinose efflux permease